MTGTYEIIYADPPWRYSAKRVQGAAENHYPTMSIDELCALPVAELAAKDSALFMWATFPQLPEALRLIRAWEPLRLPYRQPSVNYPLHSSCSYAEQVCYSGLSW